MPRDAARMIIDAHAHLIPEPLLAELRSRAAEFPSVDFLSADSVPAGSVPGGSVPEDSVPGDNGPLAFSFCGKKPTRPVARFLQDVPGRLRWMSEAGIDRQVVACWLDMFGYELPIAEG